MAITNLDIEQLKTTFLAKIGGVISGSVKPTPTDQIDLGTADQRFRTVYAQNVIAENYSGSGGGGAGVNSDTVDGFHASADPTPGYLLPLSSVGVFPPSAYDQALLTNGSRALEGNLSISPGYTVDNVDVDAHVHNGLYGMGGKINHLDLLNNDADVHPQYTQWGQDEIVTGEWMFTSFLDRTAGWKFVPSQQSIQAVPFNMRLTASPLKAEITLGASDDISLLSDGSNTRIKVGTGSDMVALSATDASYRLWAGATVGASAPFSVSKTGFLFASSGNVGGWDIFPDRIESGSLQLLSAGEIKIGTGALLGGSVYDTAVLSAIDSNGWRIWAGNPNPTAAPFRLNKYGQVFLGDAIVSGDLRSTNFVQGVSGFKIDELGKAEFNAIVARGRIETAVFSEKKISAISGTFLISEAATLKVEVLATDTTIVVDSDIFAANDIIYIKGTNTVAVPGGFETTAYSERMKIVGEPVGLAEDQYQYTVVRDLAGEGAGEFKVGQAFVRQGNASQAQPILAVASGQEEGAYGSYQPGGSGAKSEGGWLVLEGSRGVGPYFAVARRRGPIWNQFDEVVRIGNLQGIGFLDISRPDSNPYYGMVVGDAAAYWAYDPDFGLRIKTRSGSTSIDDNGIATDQLALTTAISIPSFTEDVAEFFLTKDPGQNPRVGIRMQVDGVQSEITRIGNMLKSEWDVDNDGVLDLAEFANGAPWAGITGKPSTFTPSTHTHLMGDITDYTPPDMTEYLSRMWGGF